MKTFILAAALIAVTALPALAGTAPVKSNTSRDAAIASCNAMGSAGEKLNLGTAAGCRNTETGGAILCGTDGSCTDYFADPRYKKIKQLIDRDTQRRVPMQPL